PCLHDGSVDHVASRLMDVWLLERPADYESRLAELLERYDPKVATKAIDDRLEQLVVAHSLQEKPL
ncbi:MAG: hypothetical protein NZ561_00015, partial [Phycisphaerae bacterium]|nr:hypothetical protein [Phycisphaerae bacterium]MDW8263415.1 hypothetical protein [Phycisphaerales bacterium]